MEVVEELTRYQTQWEKNGSTNYVDRTVKHSARLDAWTGWVVKTMDTEEGRCSRRQTLFSILYGSYLRREIAGTINAAWKEKNGAQAGTSDNGGTANEEEEAMGGSLKNKSAMAQWV